MARLQAGKEPEVWKSKTQRLHAVWVTYCFYVDKVVFSGVCYTIDPMCCKVDTGGVPST